VVFGIHGGRDDGRTYLLQAPDEFRVAVLRPCLEYEPLRTVRRARTLEPVDDASAIVNRHDVEMPRRSDEWLVGRIADDSTRMVVAPAPCLYQQKAARTGVQTQC
jgi:hypothetical protein